MSNEQFTYDDLNEAAELLKILDKEPTDRAIARRTNRKRDDFSKIREAMRVTLQRAYSYRLPELSKQEQKLLLRKAEYFHVYPVYRQGCTWKETEEILRADDWHYIKLAEEGLQDGGIIIGVDEDGNPMFGDDGKKLVLEGLNYLQAYNTVYLREEAGTQVSTGFEMFDPDKKKEFDMYASAVGHGIHFGWPNSVWLYSGENPDNAISYGENTEDMGGSGSGYFHINDVRPDFKVRGLGTCRLLRAKKR